MNNQPVEQTPLLAIQTLVKDKDDSARLFALVSALSDNQYALLGNLAASTNYSTRDGANIIIAKTIVDCVTKRVMSKPATIGEGGD